MLFRSCASLFGTLQHICFVYKDSCHSLTPLCAFLSKSPNNWALHHVPNSLKESLSWWLCILSVENASRSLSQWAAWHLVNGWKAAGQDIGWAESIPLEISAMRALTSGLTNAELVISGQHECYLCLPEGSILELAT